MKIERVKKIILDALSEFGLDVIKDISNIIDTIICKQFNISLEEVNDYVVEEPKIPQLIELIEITAKDYFDNSLTKDIEDYIAFKDKQEKELKDLRNQFFDGQTNDDVDEEELEWENSL